MSPEPQHGGPERDQDGSSRRGDQVRGVQANPRPHARVWPLVSTRSNWIHAQGEPTATLLLRHGQTPMSVQKRYAGLTDAPLTDAGVGQAAAAAKRLESAGIDATGAPPLHRTPRPAREVAPADTLPVLAPEG